MIPSYTIRVGGLEFEAPTYAQALAKAVQLGAKVTGHSGDLRDGGTRTLLWASSEDARDDDGTSAVGEITHPWGSGTRVKTVDCPEEDADEGVLLYHDAASLIIAWQGGIRTSHPIGVGGLTAEG